MHELTGWKRGVLTDPGDGGRQPRRSGDTADGIGESDREYWAVAIRLGAAFGGGRCRFHGEGVVRWEWLCGGIPVVDGAFFTISCKPNVITM